MMDLTESLKNYGVIVTKEERKAFCEYFLGDRKYCAATSQDSCRNCRFYSPVTGEKLMLFNQLLITETEKAKKFMEAFNEKEKEVKNLKKEIKQNNALNQRLFDEF